MMTRLEETGAAVPLRSALLAATLVIAIGLVPAAAQDKAGEEAGVEGTTPAQSGGFTPPLFGAPEQRIGAGSRELAGSDPCPTKTIPAADAGAEAVEAAAADQAVAAEDCEEVEAVPEK